MDQLVGTSRSGRSIGANSSCCRPGKSARYPSMCSIRTRASGRCPASGLRSPAIYPVSPGRNLSSHAPQVTAGTGDSGSQSAVAAANLRIQQFSLPTPPADGIDPSNLALLPHNPGDSPADLGQCFRRDLFVRYADGYGGRLLADAEQRSTPYVLHHLIVVTHFQLSTAR